MSKPPWELKQLDKRMKQGSHKSCDDNCDFLRTEILDFVKKDSTTLPIAGCGISTNKRSGTFETSAYHQWESYHNENVDPDS
jgi:hypothetical protein